MQNVMDDISRPSWWLSVIIAGFLVNLLSAYAKPVIDKYFARFSHSRQQRLEAKQLERAKHIHEVASDRFSYLELLMDLLFSTLLCATWILIAFFFTIIRKTDSDGFVFWSTTLLGLAAIALSMFRFTKVLKISSLLNEAVKLRQQDNKNEDERDPSA